MGRLLTLVVRFPLCLALLFALPSIICTIVLIVRQGSPDTAITVDTSWGQFKVEGDESTTRLQKFEAAKSTSYKKVTTGQSFHLALQTKAASRSLLQNPSYRQWWAKGLTLIYVAKDNIITRERVAKIHDIEARIAQAPGYKSYCQLYPETVDCVTPSSVINFLYPSRAGDNIVFDGKGPEMVADLPLAIQALLLANRAGFTDRDTSTNNPSSNTLISQFPFGVPLEGYYSVNDRWTEQVLKLRTFINSLEPMLQQMDEDEDLDFRVLRMGGDIIEDQIDDYLVEDAQTAIASFTFVFLLMWFYTRSFSLTTLGVIGMTMSFPPCILMCVGLYGTQFNVLSLVSLWVIAGIGADDIFVFVDMWKQTRWMEGTGDPTEVLERRIKHAFREATSAMFVTSFTTAAAFFATGTSSVLPLRVFGIYLGLLVIYNYLLVITWFPACLLAYEKAYQKYACCRKSIFCCCRKGVARVGIAEPIPLQAEEIPDEPQGESMERKGEEDGVARPMPVGRTPSPLDPCIEKYFKCLFRMRFCVLIAFVAFVIGLASQIPHLATPTDLPRLLPLTSNIEMLRQAKKDLQCSDCEYGASSTNHETSQPLKCPVARCGSAIFPTARSAPTSPTVAPGRKPTSEPPSSPSLPPTEQPVSPTSPPSTPPTIPPTRPTTIPPTPLPPTRSPPTVAPPTVAPPTIAPPTLSPPTVPPPTATSPTLMPPTATTPTALPPSALAPTPLSPTPMAPSLTAPTASNPTAIPPTPAAPTPASPTMGGALISWDLYSDSACNDEFIQVQNHSVRDVPNGACIDLHPEPAIATFFPQLSGKVACDEPGYADSANTVEVFTSSDCSGGASFTKRGAGDGCQLGQAPVNSGRVTCGTIRRSPTPQVITSPPSTPTASPPTVTPPTPAEQLISWDLYSDSACTLEFIAVQNHSAHDVPNGACIDLHPGPLVAGILPNASARVVCDDPGYADSANSMYLYPNVDCSGNPALTKQGAGDGCQLGQSPVNSGRIVCGTAHREPTSPSSPVSPTHQPSAAPSIASPTITPACADDPQGYLMQHTGQTCVAVIEYVRNCSIDLSEIDPSIPLHTYAKDLCPFTCHACPPTLPPTAPLPPTPVPICVDDPKGWLKDMSYSCDELYLAVGGACGAQMSDISRQPFPAGTCVRDVCPVKCNYCSNAPTRPPSVPSQAPTITPSADPLVPTAAPTPFPITIQEALTIHFLWGVADVNMLTANLETPGVPIFEVGFLEDDQGIVALLDIMTALSEDKDARNPNFPLMAFKSSLHVGEWPMSARRFATAFRAWIATGGTSFSSDVGFLDNPTRVAWIHGSVSTYVSRDTEGSNLEPIYVKWENKMQELNSMTQTSAKHGFQFAEQFVRMKVELAFITGLARSLGISSMLIALTIICFTQNLLIMILTLVVILAVVLCLLGFYVLWGWSFGAVEALATSLVSGLAVDYALHMGHSYNKVKGPNGEKVGRVERTRQALLGIGPSILAASATTIFSMFVLLSCSTYLFVEIGIIVSTTLLLGVIFSLCVFNAALLCFGPEGDCGNVSAMVRGFWRVLRGFARRLRGERGDMIVPNSVELQ